MNSYAADLALRRHQAAVNYVTALSTFIVLGMISYGARVDEGESRIVNKKGVVVGRWTTS